MWCVLTLLFSEMLQGICLFDSVRMRRKDSMSSQMIELIRVIVLVDCFLIDFDAVIPCFIELISKTPRIFPVENDALGGSVDPNNMSVHILMD